MKNCNFDKKVTELCFAMDFLVKFPLLCKTWTVYNEYLAICSKYLHFQEKKILVVSFLPIESSQVSRLDIGGAKAMSKVETSFGTLMQISKSNYVKNLMKS